MSVLMVCDNTEREKAFVEHYLWEVNNMKEALDQAVIYTVKKDLVEYKKVIPLALNYSLTESLDKKSLKVMSLIENLEISGGLVDG